MRMGKLASMMSSANSAPHRENKEYVLNEYTAGALYFLPSVSGNATNLGLWDSTLYEVSDVHTGSGNVTVAAIGLNITCGYPTHVVDEFTYRDLYGSAWLGNWMSAEANQSFEISNTHSNNVRGPWVNLHPPMNTSVSTIQLFQCLHDPVNQTAVVDAQSRQIQVVEPDVRKSASTWQPYVGPSHDLTVESIFDMFPLFYSKAPERQYFMAVNSDFIPNAADMYLFQKLDPLAFWENNSAKATAHATLHDVENALSALFAAMLWTVGNVPPLYGTGLTASIILLFLSLLFRVPENDTELPITELGVLHTIWLYRNHPEVKTLLSQVEHPTTESLRKAGLVRTRLVESESEQRRTCQIRPFTLADFGPDFDLDFDF
ncbi:hypothetical protein B0H11DRAFT_1936990 [Mycena galericulata]|nr:hypothetical protein B0H11DRAFT_1936990 [Mycena galericulata]